MTSIYCDVTNTVGYSEKTSADAVVTPDGGSVTLKPTVEQGYQNVFIAFYRLSQFSLTNFAIFTERLYQKKYNHNENYNNYIKIVRNIARLVKRTERTNKLY